MLTVKVVLILCIVFCFIIRKVSKKRVEEDKITIKSINGDIIKEMTL